MPTLYAIHCDAGRGKNGNPKRLFLVFDQDGYRIDCIYEGYKGRAAVTDKHGNITILTKLSITKEQYKELLNSEN